VGGGDSPDTGSPCTPGSSGLRMSVRICLTLLLCCGLQAQTPTSPSPSPPEQGGVPDTPQFLPPFPTGAVLTSPQAVYYINSGGPAVPADTTDPKNPIPPYIADTFFSGGVTWTDPAMGTGRWATLRYAHNFTYDIPLPNGIYTIRFDMLETTYLAPNMRVFTITANGVQSDPIDLFKITGGINIHAAAYLMAVVGNGHLHIVFQSTRNNATVSAITIGPSAIYYGLESHFIRFYPCDMLQPPTTCIQINPWGQPPSPLPPPPLP
jgi:hypothetical protein